MIMSRERDLSIDVAKGITILLVVYGHLQNPINEFIYSFHMPAFFFMSGMFAKEMSFKDTIIQKGHRLLFPFLIYYVYMLVMKIGRLVLSGKISVASFLPQNQEAIYYSIGPIWFLIALFYIFIIYSLTSKCKIMIQFVLAIGISIVPFVHLGTNPWYINSALLGYLFFVVGLWSFNFFGGGKKNKHCNLVYGCCRSCMLFSSFCSSQKCHIL